MRKLFMAVFLTIFFTIWISSGLILYTYEYNEFTSAILGFTIAAAIDWLLTKIIFYFIKFFPLIIQKPFYLAWKENLLIINAKSDPLFAYPITAFIELELDKYFEEGGIKNAEVALLNKINNVGQSILDTIDKLREKK